jgi:hypothetical protein
MKDQIKTGELNTGAIIHALKQISHGIQSNIQAELKSYYANPDKVAKQDLITEFEYTLFHLAEMEELINAIASNNWDAKTFSIKDDLYKFIENYLNNAPLHNLAMKLQNCSTRIYGINKAQENGVKFGRKFKLTRDKVQQIRESLDSEKSVSDILKEFNISRSTYYIIKSGRHPYMYNDLE